MRSRATSLLSLGLIWLLLVGGHSHAQESPPTEYQIKAAFLFNFAKFVEWPPAAFPAGTSPIVIGILGENPFHDDLARMVRSKTVDGRTLEVKTLHSLADAANCHMLFISTSESARLPEIIKSLKGASVLTVGETDHFTENGGMINFVLKSAKVRFEINKTAATSAGLKISSKLMSLALRPGD
ncbi:MAG: YfiR family protein [Limisphaerales bacterium]